MDFNRLNAHARDPHISFDAETHTYTLGGEVFDSVTTIVEDCFEKFDADYWATAKSRGDEAQRRRLLDEWERKGREAREAGTLMHERIERHYLGCEPDPGSECDPTFIRFLAFARQFVLRPYRSEWRIYSEPYRVAGTLDFLERRPDGRFVIYDWKRSTKVVSPDGRILDNCYGRTARRPISTLQYTTYNHYALQVSIYRYILELHYGIRVSEAYLGVFHPDMPGYYRVALPYLRDEAEALLKSRLQ